MHGRSPAAFPVARAPAPQRPRCAGKPHALREMQPHRKEEPEAERKTKVDGPAGSTYEPKGKESK
jgi:hypothetical protein